MPDSDIHLSDLITLPGAKQIKLEWASVDPNSDGLPYLKRSAVEVWSSATNQRPTAILISDAVGDDFLHAGLVSGVTRYYWVRARNVAGYYGDWEPLNENSGSAGTPT